MCAEGLSGHRETRAGRTQNTLAALKTPDQRWGLKKPETREQSRLWLPHWARGPDAEACLVGREYLGVPIPASGKVPCEHPQPPLSALHQAQLSFNTDTLC